MSNTFNEKVLNTFLHNLEEDGVETHAVCVWHNGKQILNKAYEPYDVHTVHPVWSITKSFTSIALGFLMQEDPVDLNQPWIDFFPEYRSEASARFCKATIRNLLTMTLGQDAEVLPKPGDDWILDTVHKPVIHEPGTTFFYNSMCTYLIGRLIEKKTGMPLIEYLRPRLFEPLGFTDYYWDRDEQGHCIGGYGLHLVIEDLARLGQCILQNGEWNGKQILPAKWLKEATRKQVDNAAAYPAGKSEDRQGYGYCFWRCTRDAFRMSGLHGQLCYIEPSENLVIAMSNAALGSQVLLDNLNDACTCPGEWPGRREICTLPSGTEDSAYLPWILGTHPAYKNPAGIRSITVSQKENALVITIDKEGKSYTFRAAYGRWLEQKNLFHGYTDGFWSDIILSGDKEHRTWPAYGAYAFALPDELHIEVRERNEAAQHHFIFRISRDYLSLDYYAEALLTYFPAYHAGFPLKEKQNRRS